MQEGDHSSCEGTGSRGRVVRCALEKKIPMIIGLKEGSIECGRKNTVSNNFQCLTIACFTCIFLGW